MKEKQRTPSIGFRTDMPFEERHGMRFEATYTIPTTNVTA
ncbi:TPA: hypothetical protein ACFNMU_002191 [Neisseria lactamica]